MLMMPGLWPVRGVKGCRLILMMRGLRPAALKGAARDAHDARPEAGFAAKRVAS